jgi:hypothetical protein
MESMSSSSSSIHSTSAASDVLSSSHSSATKKDVKTDNQALKILNQIRTKVAKVFIPKKSNSNKSKTSQKINLPQRVINSFVNEVKSVLKALNKKSEQFDEAINAYVHENFQIPGFESQEINEENDVGTTKSEESKTLDEGIIRDFTPRLKMENKKILKT